MRKNIEVLQTIDNLSLVKWNDTKQYVVCEGLNLETTEWNQGRGYFELNEFEEAETYFNELTKN